MFFWFLLPDLVLWNIRQTHWSTGQVCRVHCSMFDWASGSGKFEFDGNSSFFSTSLILVGSGGWSSGGDKRCRLQTLCLKYATITFPCKKMAIISNYNIHENIVKQCNAAIANIDPETFNSLVVDRSSHNQRSSVGPAHSYHVSPNENVFPAFVCPERKSFLKNINLIYYVKFVLSPYSRWYSLNGYPFKKTV